MDSGCTRLWSIKSPSLKRSYRLPLPDVEGLAGEEVVESVEGRVMVWRDARAHQ